ncbi:MAG: penicillin acylase family protein [Actinomycetota bacterium]|nr:penicillin acylase family protein [Actinomycetota bacterium]
MHRLRRHAITAAVVLALLLVAGTLTGLGFARQSFPQTDGEIVVPGLAAEVEVVRDEYGVPQIYADNAEDLFFAQGFVQAQDRFFQMDVRRHATAGRLAELFGEQALDSDMLVRTMGWRRVAEREFALLDANTRRYLEAFSDGVNAYLDDRDVTDMSLEYAVLGLGGLDYTPEEWTPVDSLAWLKAMAWDLRSNMQDETDRALSSAVLSPGEISELYPPYPTRRHQPVVRSGAVVGGRFVQREPRDDARRPARPAYSPEAVRAMEELHRVSGEMPALLGSGDGLGSNAWAVAGSRTNTGQPLLANDPHLEPSMPGIWYQMGLHCTDVGPRCPFDVSGFTFAGLPGVAIGHNRRIAWGFTNLAADVSDLYVERVSKDTYRYDGRDLPLERRRETFRVAGGRDVTITVRATRHGPIVSDVDEQLRRVGGLSARRLEGHEAGQPDDEGADETRPALALRWTALDPSHTADALFAINRAGDWREFRAAAEEFAVPSQNLVYADVEGHIGYQAPGRIPVRGKGTGEWPRPGWDPAYDWKSFIPFEALPHVLDPRQGYVVTANQAVVDPSYRYYLGDDWDYGYRSQRLVKRIEDELSWTVEETARLQMDSRSGNAASLLPYLLDLSISQRYVRQGQRVLEGWDLTQAGDSAGAAYFNVVWRNLLAETFHDQLPQAVWPDGGSQWFEVVRTLLTDPRAHWWDDVRTDEVQETRDDILERAMTQARYEMTRKQVRDPHLWGWGHLHRLELEHDTLGQSGNPLVESLFNRGPYQLGGSSGAVNATGWTAHEGYAVDAVPSMRMVVSLGDLDESRWVNLTGASGHAMSSHYNDQFELWRDGETTAWPFTRPEVDDAGEDRLFLLPRRPSEQ